LCSLIADLVRKNADYQAAELSLSTRFLFTSLRFIQILAYGMGWRRALKRKEDFNSDSSWSIKRVGSLKTNRQVRIPLSVIVPVYNRLALTQRLLDSFLASNSRFEILMVDDASSDPIEELVESYANLLDVYYIKSQNNRGPATARNLGIRHASHEMVAFTDNDARARKIRTSHWPRLEWFHHYIACSPTP
jgi:cellulose synthase/poly-beta-1,6-N-acetylglucosamine synthase-like glycosyltransferase